MGQRDPSKPADKDKKDKKDNDNNGKAPSEHNPINPKEDFPGE